MKFAIVGVGAIGGLTGAYLVKHGEDVSFYDVVPEHIDAMSQKGLLVDGEGGEFRVPVNAKHLSDLRAPLDIVMIAVKGHHTLEVLRTVEPLLNPTSTIVSLQNGLNAWRIADRVGPERVIAVFLNFGADYVGPGHVRFGGFGDYFIGRPDAPPDDLVKQIAEKFRMIQNTVVTDNIRGYLWSKLCWTTLLMGTALVEVPVYEAVASPVGRMVFTAAFRESIAVADAYKIKLEAFKPFDPAIFANPHSQDRIDQFYAGVEHMYRNRVKQHTGTWRDIAVLQRKTEVDWLAGDLIRRGEEKGLSLPIVSGMVEMVHQIEDGKRVQSMRNLTELYNRLRS